MVTLYDSQEKFYEICYDYFGDIFYKKAKKGGTVDSITIEMVNDYGIETIMSMIYTMENENSLFWKNNYEAIAHDVENKGGVKVNYLGIMPQNHLPFITKSLIYVDTLLLTNPIFHEARILFSNIADEIKGATLGNFFRRLYDTMDVKDIVLSEKIPPLAFIPWVSDYFVMTKIKEDHYKRWRESQSDRLDFANEILGKNFSTFKELFLFLKGIKNVDEYVQSIKKYEYFELAGSSNVYENIKTSLEYYARSLGSSIDNLFSCPEQIRLKIFKEHLCGGAGGINQFLLNLKKFRSSLITDEKIDFSIFLWKLRNDNNKIKNGLGTKMGKIDLVPNILQLDDFKWLGNVPLESIEKIRNEGKLQDLREIFKKELDSTQVTDEKEFQEIVVNVKYNLEKAFKKHKDEVAALDKEFRRKRFYDSLGLSVGVISGIASLYPPLSYFSPIASTSVGGVSAVDLIRTEFEYRQNKKELGMKPVGLLLKAYETTNADA